MCFQIGVEIGLFCEVCHARYGRHGDGRCVKKWQLRMACPNELFRKCLPAAVLLQLPGFPYEYPIAFVDSRSHNRIES